MNRKINKKKKHAVISAVKKNNKTRRTDKKPARDLKSDENPKESNQNAINAFIFSLIGFLLPIPIVNIILLGVGFAKGIKAMNEFKESPGKYKGKGFAITAIVLGAIGIVALLIFLGLILAL